jgi:hypothetical protein
MNLATNFKKENSEMNQLYIDYSKLVRIMMVSQNDSKKIWDKKSMDYRLRLREASIIFHGFRNSLASA